MNYCFQKSHYWYISKTWNHHYHNNNLLNCVCRTTHNSHDVESTVNKENVCVYITYIPHICIYGLYMWYRYIYIRILFCHKKEWNSVMSSRHKNLWFVYVCVCADLVISVQDRIISQLQQQFKNFKCVKNCNQLDLLPVFSNMSLPFFKMVYKHR